MARGKLIRTLRSMHAASLIFSLVCAAYFSPGFDLRHQLSFPLGYGYTEIENVREMNACICTWPRAMVKYVLGMLRSMREQFVRNNGHDEYLSSPFVYITRWNFDAMIFPFNPVRCMKRFPRKPARRSWKMVRDKTFPCHFHFDVLRLNCLLRRNLRR